MNAGHGGTRGSRGCDLVAEQEEGREVVRVEKGGWTRIATDPLTDPFQYLAYM